MYKTALYAKCPDRCPPCPSGISRKFLQNVKHTRFLFIHNIHDRYRRYITRFKHWFPVRIDNRIVRIYFSKNEFFHNINGVRPFFFKKCFHFFIRCNLECMRSTYPIIWLGNNRIADFFCKSKTVFQGINHMETCCWNSCLLVTFFHF